jgi:hypothetical protein
MQSRSQAAEGGRHFIASTLTVYNELALERPDLLEALATPNWTFDKYAYLPLTSLRIGPDTITAVVELNQKSARCSSTTVDKLF